MMSFIAMNRTVTIDLKPGLYVFHPASASGKTLLLKMVKSIGDRKKTAVTYNDILMGIDPDRIADAAPELLILDRFDLYDDRAAVLRKLKNANCITLVDYKTQRHFNDFDDTCFVTLKKDALEVSL